VEVGWGGGRRGRGGGCRWEGWTWEIGLRRGWEVRRGSGGGRDGGGEVEVQKN
jgi:hypothetical protein